MIRPRFVLAGAVAVVMLGTLTASSQATRDAYAAESAGHLAGGTANAGASRVSFDEDFTAGLDTSRWNTCFWWGNRGCTIATNHELEWYLPSGVSVTNGALRLTASAARVKNPQGRVFPYRSGMVTTGPVSERGSPAKLAFTYGRVEARVRMTRGAGLWPAVWLLPASRNSRPEIDILEVVGQHADEALLHLHPASPHAASLESRNHLPGPDFADAWHTVALNWEPGRLEWFLDGKLIWRVLGQVVPAEPMYLVLNLAVGGDYPGTPPSNRVFPATFSIDYVRIRP